MIGFHNVRDIRLKWYGNQGDTAWVELSLDMEDTVDVCFYVPSKHDHIAHRKMAAIVNLLQKWPPNPLVEEAKAPDSPPSE